MTRFAERIASFGTWAYEIRTDSFAASEGAVRLLLPGADPALFTFGKVLDLVHPDQRPTLRRAHDAALRTGQVHEAEFRLVEGERWFTILFMRVLDESGEPAFTCGTIHETTGLRAQSQLRAQVDTLQAAEAIRARFVNAAAHELSQPLTPMRLELSQLAKLVPQDGSAARAFHVVQRNVDRLEYMLRDLLDAARSQAGRLRVDLQTVDVTQQVQQVVDTLQPLAEQRCVGIVWKPPLLPPVLADPMRTQQCVSNLLHNAIKFTPEGTAIVVEARGQPDSVAVEVKDAGPGFTNEQRGLLFEPFQQIHRAPSGFAGTGLGLYITRALMKTMHGSIAVESTPGVGATFRLTFPLLKARIAA